MWSRSAALYAICIGYAAAGGVPVAAPTMQECSAKYRGGQLGNWEAYNLATISSGQLRSGHCSQFRDRSPESYGRRSTPCGGTDAARVQRQIPGC